MTPEFTLPLELNDLLGGESVPQRRPEDRIVIDGLYVGVLTNTNLRLKVDAKGIDLHDLIDHGDAHTGIPEVGILRIYAFAGANEAYHTLAAARRYVLESDLNGMKRPALERLNILRETIGVAERKRIQSSKS